MLELIFISERLIFDCHSRSEHLLLQMPDILPVVLTNNKSILIKRLFK